MTEQQIKFLLDQYIQKKIKATVCTDGTIKAVNADYTCDVQIGSSEFYGVPLEVLISSQASIIGIPVVGSACVIIFRDNDISYPQIIKIHQVDQLLINCETSVIYNGGKLGGMVKAKELQAQSNKDKAILDAFLQVLQTPVTEPGNGAPSAFQATLLSALGSLKAGTWDNLENPVIQQ